MRMLLSAILWLIMASHVYTPNRVGLGAVSKTNIPLTFVLASTLRPFFHLIWFAGNNSLSFITEQVSTGGASMLLAEITCSVASIIICGRPKFPSKSMVNKMYYPCDLVSI